MLGNDQEDRSTADRLVAVLEGMGDCFYAVDAEWRFTYVNRSAEAYFDQSRNTLIGRRVWEVFPWMPDSPIGIPERFRWVRNAPELTTVSTKVRVSPQSGQGGQSGGSTAAGSVMVRRSATSARPQTYA